ncbi:hypothetical protein ABSA28_00188 [Candidatus Hepatincolaceae symbiont of Richtersius coronifer]
MKVKHYSQYSKKTLLMGMDRRYLLSLSVAIIFVSFIFFVFKLPLGINVIFALISLVFSFFAFQNNHYWVEHLIIRNLVAPSIVVIAFKVLLKKIIKPSYKEINNMLPR